MLQSFQGRAAFITGGASGIGLGMAEAFAANGLRIALADIDGALAENEAARLRAEGYEACAVQLEHVPSSMNRK